MKKLAMALGLLALMLPVTVWAHASEQGFVLLLPTDAYIAAGVLTVIVTVVLLALMPVPLLTSLFRPRSFPLISLPMLRAGVNLISSFTFLWVIYQGFVGFDDPVLNPLPILIWTLWWVGLVIFQGLIGDIWAWLNPWRAPAWLITNSFARLRYPVAFGYWPSVLQFLAFSSILMADIAPKDPKHLARYVSAYVLVNLAGLLIFGRRWLLRCEWVNVVMRLYGRMAICGRKGGRGAIGAFGWQVMRAPAFGPGLAVLTIALLASGSFDGLNETFFWLAQLGINPLEFPGRSAVVWPNLIGLMAMNLGLLAMFVLTLWVGKKIARVQLSLRMMLCQFAPGLLPIALAYHIGHYLTVLLVDGQYVLKILLAPWQDVHVTTGFLFQPDSVRMIWLSQAGAIVIGHMVAILLSHLIAVRSLGDNRRAWVVLFPLTIFMIMYTLFGLWLLATPRGV